MKQQEMLRDFDAFIESVVKRYAEARECLENGEYRKAQEILARLSTSHARTSLSLRNVLVRDGLLPEEDK